MKDTAQSLGKWAAAQEGRVSDNSGQVYSVWMVLDLFYALQYINDPRYVKEDRKGREGRVIGARKPSMQFRASRTLLREKFRKLELLQMAAFRNVKVGEKFFWNKARSSCLRK